MQRAKRWLGLTLIALLGLPLLGLVVLVAATNSQPGRAFIERAAATLSAGEVIVTGLDGRFPDALRVQRLALRDASGVWLQLDGLALDWRAARLLTGTLWIDRLEAEHIDLERLPVYPPSETSAAKPSLPLAVTLRRLHVGRAELGAAVAGEAASLTMDGSARLATLAEGELDLVLQRLDKAGTYQLQGRLDAAEVQARLSAREPGAGLLASLAGLSEQNALSLEASLEGPLAAVATRFALQWGALNAALEGQLDFDHATADLVATASAPAMRPRADASWRALALDAKVQGQFAQPTVNGVLHVDDLNIAGTGARAIALAVRGESGRLHVDGELDGLTLPAAKLELLQRAPIKLQADVGLDAPERPVTFSIKHPYLTAAGSAVTAGSPSAKLELALPELKPVAALAGLELQGAAALTLNAAQQDDAILLDAEGALDVTGGAKPLSTLLGGKTKVVTSATRRGADMTLSRFRLDGKQLSAEAKGALAGKSVDFDWRLALADVSAVAASIAGKLAAQGRINGLTDDFGISADLNGELATANFPRKPVTAKLQLEHLPDAYSGRLNADAVLAGAPLTLALTAKNLKEEGIQVTLDRANWKSATATGVLVLPRDAGLPAGKIDARMARLADLQTLLKQPLTGSLSARFESKNQAASVQLDARSAGLSGVAEVEHAAFNATLTELTRSPLVDGQLTLTGLSAGTLTGSAQLGLAGAVKAPDLRLSAVLDDLAGAPLKLGGAASLDTPASRLDIAQLQVDWNNESLRLLAPAQVEYADGVNLRRFRLGLRDATLDLDGRIAPTLAMTASLHKLPLDVLGRFAPRIAATGRLNAEARLNGSLAQPEGDVVVEVTDARIGSSRALPAAKLKATANLAGGVAQINAELAAGPSVQLSARGQAPLTMSGPLALNASGTLDLKLFDPLLNAAGRRARGQLTLAAALAGTLAAPQVTGSARLADGEIRDYAIGANITGIEGLLRADNGMLHIDRLEGRAGQGTIAASGAVDLVKPGLPVNLTVTARNARPLASDRLTVNLNSDLTLRGSATGQLNVAGAILIKRADIRIPERMPTSIAVLKMSTPGAPAPAPSSPPDSNVALDLILTAPGKIFVRGRGLDAELDGTVRLRGTAASPEPEGYFTLRRGQFNLAGKALSFTKGVVGFDGGSLTDPSLNFVANTTSDNYTATLTIEGTASKPKITLSSVPELPQDEILARLLFNRGTASLSVMEMVQIGAAVASLTGVTSGLVDPLESVRKKLSLDRLSVGGANGALEAGRYLAPGVYVGAKQGVTTSSTQATVQIDLTKQLKLEASVGTAAPTAIGKTTNTQSIGVIYQFEY